MSTEGSGCSEWHFLGENGGGLIGTEMAPSKPEDFRSQNIDRKAVEYLALRIGIEGTASLQNDIGFGGPICFRHNKIESIHLLKLDYIMGV